MHKTIVLLLFSTKHYWWNWHQTIYIVYKSSLSNESHLWRLSFEWSDVPSRFSTFLAFSAAILFICPLRYAPTTLSRYFISFLCLLFLFWVCLLYIFCLESGQGVETFWRDTISDIWFDLDVLWLGSQTSSLELHLYNKCAPIQHKLF